MSPEKFKQPSSPTTSHFAGVGRYVDDDKWLSQFQTTFQEMSNNLGLDFTPQETPALIYTTRSDTSIAVSEAYLPMLEGREGTKAVIKELIDLGRIDGLIALSGLTLAIEGFISRDVPNRSYWRSTVKFYDIRASLVDLPVPRDNPGTVINNERQAIQRAFGVRTSQPDEFGLPKIEVRLGTIGSPKDATPEITEKLRKKLYYLLPKKLTLKPLSKLK